MLGKRIATAIIGIVAAFFIVNYGKGIFAGAVLLLALLAWHEYSNMLRRHDIAVSDFLGIILIILLWGTVWLGNTHETIAVLYFSLFVVTTKTVISCARFAIHDAAFTLMGILYIGLTFSHLVLLRFTDSSLIIATPLGSLSAGAAYLWLALVGTWASDTFAFFVGSKLGKVKLCPAISPGKTREGAAGGVIGSVIAVTLLGYLFHLPLIHGVSLGLLVGIVAPLGDLAESALKRWAGVKDSGRLLPGHGGVLDRFDSIMFAVPAVYYYILLFVAR